MNLGVQLKWLTLRHSRKVIRHTVLNLASMHWDMNVKTLPGVGYRVAWLRDVDEG